MIFYLKGGDNMKHISIHPIEYLRAHLVYEKIRINLLSLITSPIIIPLLLIAIVLGGLYTTLAQLGNIAPVATDRAYTNSYPYEMPTIVMSPMGGAASYLII
jgi:hypothetical protein